MERKYNFLRMNPGKFMLAAGVYLAGLGIDMIKDVGPVSEEIARVQHEEVASLEQEVIEYRSLAENENFTGPYADSLNSSFMMLNYARRRLDGLKREQWGELGKSILWPVFLFD